MERFDTNEAQTSLKEKFPTHLGCTVAHVHGLRLLLDLNGGELLLLRAQVCCSDPSLLTNVNTLTPVLIKQNNRNH